MDNEWLYAQLSDLLQFPVPQDMIDYITSITNVRDLEDYMKTLLDFGNPQHKRFLQELLQRRKGCGLGYKKNEVEENYIAPSVEKKKKEKGTKSQNSVNQQKKSPEQQIQTKKKKFVNLYSQEGQSRDVVMLKGRQGCDCQASKHRLINNCLKCGRIVCKQEGSGPCLFCGNLVCSREEQECLNSGSKQSSQLLQKLMDQKPPGYDSAIEQRNRLLEYDRTSEKRTRVIDDESDYFSINSVWLSQSERDRLKQKEEEMQARKHQSRKSQTLTLDLGLKRLIESKPVDNIDLSEIDEVLQDIRNSVNSSQNHYYETDNKDPSVIVQPRYDEDVMYDLERGRKGFNYSRGRDSHSKIQDRAYLEMVDEGLCMSMHQPWASLLVAGIKLHEGRDWYTPHRGRLWIAAASKPPVEADIEQTQGFYISIRGIKQFPLTYPTSCLLGCVNVVDCLPQEEYKARYPDGENDSPFVFICESPQELPIRFPISGKHKIYKLDTSIHLAAQKAMQRIAKIKSDKNCQSLLRNI